MQNNNNNNYAVNSGYSGPKVLEVPVRMYSRNSLLGAMHMKSKRYLNVDLEKSVFAFHKSKDPKDHQDKTHEIAFSKITNIETDVSKASSHKYYMIVHTAEGELKFKFKNAADFHQVADALANVTHNSKAFHQPSEDFNKFNKDYKTNQAAYAAPITTHKDHIVGQTATGQTTTTTTTDHHRNKSASSVSSDSAKEYKYEDEARDRVKKDSKVQDKQAKDQQKWTDDEVKDRQKNAKDLDKQNEKNVEDAQKKVRDDNKESEKIQKASINDNEKYAKESQKHLDEANKDASNYNQKNIEHSADYAKKNVEEAGKYQDKQIDQSAKDAKDATKY